MKILWLVSKVLPQVGKALGLPAENEGGWIVGQLGQLKHRAEITVCTVCARAGENARCTLDGADYVVLPRGEAADFARLLDEVKPDLVHLWGSEYPPAMALQTEAEAAGVPVLLSVQGLMGPCAEHLLDGVPEQYCGSCFVQRCIDRVVPGELLDKKLAYFKRQAQVEKVMLARQRHVTGRTQWDREQLAVLAPKAAYYPCGETLRPTFYGPEWNPEAQDPEAPVLFLSQGNYPLKGLHRLLKALPKVLARYPKAKLVIAGWPPLERGALLRPVIDWMFPYQNYTKTLIRQLGLQGAVHYTGPLNEQAICEQYLHSSLYVLCSSMENSPNSLGEAMLLGMPCVASDVGGVSSLLTHEREGLLYPAEDENALAEAILALLDDPARARRLGKAAQARARVTHDPEKNAADMLTIYRQAAGGKV